MPHLNAAQAVHKPVWMVFIPEEHPVRFPLLRQEGIPWKQICIVEISSSLSWRAHLPRAFRYDRAFWLLKAPVACLSLIKMCVRGSGTETVRNATWAPFTAELSGTLNFQRCLPDPLCLLLHDTQTASPLTACCWNKTSSHANSSAQRQQGSFLMGCFTDRTHWSTFFYISGRFKCRSTTKGLLFCLFWSYSWVLNANNHSAFGVLASNGSPMWSIICHM